MRGGAFFNGKEGRDDFRKTDIRSRFSEPYASIILLYDTNDRLKTSSVESKFLSNRIAPLTTKSVPIREFRGNK